MRYLSQAINFLSKYQTHNSQDASLTGDFSTPEIRERVRAFINGVNCQDGGCGWTGDQLRAWMPLIKDLLLPHGEEGLMALPDTNLVPIIKLIDLVNTDLFYQVFSNSLSWLKDHVKPEYAAATHEVLCETNPSIIGDKVMCSRKKMSGMEQNHPISEKSELSEKSMTNCSDALANYIASGFNQGTMGDGRIRCVDCLHYQAGESSLHALGLCTTESWDGHKGQWPFRLHQCKNFRIKEQTCHIHSPDGKSKDS